MPRLLLLSIFTLCFLQCTPKLEVAEKANVEFRGVWIATVMNIDWPRQGHTDWESQRTHFLALLKFYQKLKYNAVVVQIRTAGDAFYPTDKAPWSRFLTGKEGRAPQEIEDPLTWMIEAAHAHGMEFHAWMNPFRATMDANTRQLNRQHVYRQHRDWMVRYGGKYYINPGIPEARTTIQEIINEVVSNYDIDAIHFDDYFYPYKKKGATFNDTRAYRKRADKNLSLADWRRANINEFVQQCQAHIKRIKPWVEFGISPFGVWRNQAQDAQGSDTQASISCYDDLYADVRLWAEKGWVDYIVPQLYWSMDYELASYRKLIDWWSKNHGQAKLYIGLGTYKVKNNHDAAWNDIQEIPAQIELARNTPNVQGHVSFSAKSLAELNFELSEILRSRTYSWRAMTPEAEARGKRPFSFSKIKNILADGSMQLSISNLPAYFQEGSVKYLLEDEQKSQWIEHSFNARDTFALKIPAAAKAIKLQCLDGMGRCSLEMGLD